MTHTSLTPPQGYDDLLRELRERIAGAQVRAALAVNHELVLLYWQIGREILARQRQEGWGAKVIARLSRDLRREFPEMKGFSTRNLTYMRAFAEAWPDEAFVQEVLAQITWYHNVTLLEKVSAPETRIWYARQAIQHGWSRNVLVHQVERDLHGRQGRALTNFAQTLPPSHSDLARSLLKDPYTFDFLTIGEDARERDLEQALTRHIRDFLLELGVGFAFVGSQYHMEVGGQDFYLDMLFYHLKLRCYVALDLKVGEFTPEHAGKMNFYLSAIDAQLRHPDDQPSIGLILCKTKNQVVVEYALRDVRKPIGIAEYQITQALPDHLQGSLPTIEELEATLDDPGAAEAESL
jgi:predicted nuclease of restriction endonuclease-like (RecB) superfamily